MEEGAAPSTIISSPETPPENKNNETDDFDVMEEVSIKEDNLDKDYADKTGVSSSSHNMEGENIDDVHVEPTFFSDEKGNLKFVNAVVRYPCTIFWGIMIACLVLTLLLIVIISRDGNPFSLGTEMDVDDVRSIQFDSLRLAQEEVVDIREKAAGAMSIPRQSEEADFTYWVFEGQQPEGVFGSVEAIEAMKEAFDLFMDDAQFDQYCLLKYPAKNGNATNGTSTEPYCDVPISPLTFYYASEWDSDKVAATIEQLKIPGNIETFNDLALCYTSGLFCEELAAQDISEEDIAFAIELGANLTDITSKWDMSGELVENITQVTELAAYLTKVDTFKGFVDFGYDTGFSVDNLVSKYSRGLLLWGGPLDDSNLTPEEKEDQEETEDDVRKDYVTDTFLDAMNDLAKSSTHRELNSYYFMGTLLLDVLLDIVTQDAMLAIISLVFVFIWLRVNTGSWFLSAVGIFEIMFSIPIAWFFFSVVFRIKFFAFLNALSIFIVAAIGADDIFIFMDAYKQSAHRHPENLSSLETRMSWVYRRTGIAMAISSATTCAAFLCTLITPLVTIQSFGIFAAFVILIDYFLVMTLFCTAVVIYHDRFEDRSCFGCCFTDCSKTNPTPTRAAQEILQSGSDEYTGDRVSNFFRTKVAGFILVPINRVILAVFFLSWLGVAIWQTTQIEAVKEAEQFLDEDHPLQKSITILNNEFPTADDDVPLKVYYAWGIGEVDRSSVNLLLDPENFGDSVFLESFNFNEQCQTELVNACEKLKTDPAYEGLIKRKGGVGEVYCFMEELAAYNVRGNLDDCEYVTQLGWQEENWQVSPDNLRSVMEGFLQERSCVESSETISGYYTNEIGWDGTSMRYAAIAVGSEVLDPFSQVPESETRREYDQFVALAAELDKNISQACGVGEVIMTDLDEKFIFMNNQSIYVQTAVQAAILGVVIAFTVLLFATRVLHIAFFASLSIMSVLVSVTGTMVMMGWELGSIESILIGIIAGFSVDYVVHLAHAYEVAEGDTAARLRSAFGDMGISVMNGMITSIGASIPLFLCQLQFFAKFGTFLCFTIMFSWLFANFAFTSVLATFKIPIKKSEGCFGFRL